MRPLLKNLLLKFLTLLRPILERTLLRNQSKILEYQSLERDTRPSGMVTSFNFFDALVFQPFFKRVRTVKPDVTRVKELCRKGPVVFVMKNRGQLEYRYFNHLFLREKIEPVRFANGCFTAGWRRFSEIWRYTLAKLADFYAGILPFEKSDEESVAAHIASGENVLINLSVSRDYLFGLFKTNPLAKVRPLLDLQRQSDLPITIVPAQFLYDKQPEKSEKSFFDLLFGDKSRPGGIRKALLFVMGLRRQPQAQFGGEINLKEFLAQNAAATDEGLTKSLYAKIEETLSIEHARITGPKLKPRDTMIREILSDPTFAARLREIAASSDESFESLKNRAKSYLEEIAADVNYSYVHFSWLALNYLWNEIFDGVVVKHDQLNRVRELAGKHPVVLVPMHRSHIDYLLVTHIFYANNITFPHICAGINMNFWPIGHLVRKCGGFFIRRRFDGNAAYKESLYAYVKSLVDQGYCIEFFIEGTRSRTGKMLKPKLGILGQIMQAWKSGTRDDVYFLPIAVNYDQLIEQKSYESEGAGADKKKEDAGQLIKAGKVLGRKYGKVYVEFAEPVSLKNYMAARGVTKSDDDEKMKKEVDGFGYHLTYAMNRVAVITPVALVSLGALALKSKAFTFEQLVNAVTTLKDYLDHKEARYSDLIQYSDRWAYGEAVQLLQSQGLLKEVKTFEENFYALDDAGRIRLDYYKNNILHFFVSLSCFCKIAAAAGPNETLPFTQALKTYELLKQLLRNDFTFSARTAVEEHLKRVMSYCRERGFIAAPDDFSHFSLTLSEDNRAAFSLFNSLVDNFLESHLVVLRYLKHNRFESTEVKLLVKDILEKSKPLYLKDDLKFPEALNRFNLENALKTCADLGLIKQSGSRDKPAYAVICEPETADKWVRSVQDFLRAAPIQMQAPTSRAPITEEREGLH